ncbi:CBS domain-containing protein [Oceanimonas sp. NS1]|nr:CBS domain-containing protein [Oceanimonas sp. NS1]
MTHPDTTPAHLSLERLMHTGLLTCSPDTPLREAAASMASRRCSSVLILEQGRAVGIWTERDSLRLDFSCPDSLNQPIRRVMSRPVHSLPAILP